MLFPNRFPVGCRVALRLKLWLLHQMVLAMSAIPLLAVRSGYNLDVKIIGQVGSTIALDLLFDARSMGSFS